MLTNYRMCKYEYTYVLTEKLYRAMIRSTMITPLFCSCTPISCKPQ